MNNNKFVTVMTPFLKEVRDEMKKDFKEKKLTEGEIRAKYAAILKSRLVIDETEQRFEQ